MARKKYDEMDLSEELKFVGPIDSNYANPNGLVNYKNAINNIADLQKSGYNRVAPPKRPELLSGSRFNPSPTQRVIASDNASALAQGNGPVNYFKTNITVPTSQSFADMNNMPEIKRKGVASANDGAIGHRLSDADSKVEATLPSFSNAETPQYNSQYQAMIDNLLNDIINADKFSYDAANDDLFKYYAKEYQKAGDLAARDSMGRAMAASGGFGNTYAQTVAQQVQNGYNSQLTDMIPEFEQNAYSRYVDELSRQQNNLGLLMDAEKNDYNRYLDALSQQNYLNELAYEREQDAIEQQNYLNELALAQLETEAKAKDEGTTDNATGEMADDWLAMGINPNATTDNLLTADAAENETPNQPTSPAAPFLKNIASVIIDAEAGIDAKRDKLIYLYENGLDKNVFEELAKKYGLV